MLGTTHGCSDFPMAMSPGFYHREAVRFRLLAKDEPDPAKAELLRRMALESETLSRELEGAPRLNGARGNG
jgi:hypothetical protein